MSEKVTPFPVKVRDNSKQITLANPYSGCQHKRAIVDPKLLELECADCHAKLNPIQFLVMLANTEAAYEWKQGALRQQRKKIEERSRCRCTKCGEWTEVRRVGQREVERIKGGANQ
jgi:hypothetical protein